MNKRCPILNKDCIKDKCKWWQKSKYNYDNADCVLNKLLDKLQIMK